MKRNILTILTLVLAIAAGAQTLNVKVGNVTYQFPAEQVGDMIYVSGTTLTIMNKDFAISEISNMTVDDTAVTDNTVAVDYDGTSANITVAGNVAQYLTIAQSGAHVSIAQNSDLASEITYTLSGSSTNGEFYMSGSYKATVEFNGLTLTNQTPVYSGAAVHIQNGKRIKVKPITGTTTTLVDAASGSQKGCLYIKGHAEFAQKGTLNVKGNVKHGIKAGEYITLKNATINVTSAVGDGISCNQYFLMESGTVSISGTGDDGLQCEIDDTTAGSTGETTDHDGEDSGSIYITGGSITVNVSAAAAKGIKCDGDMKISGDPTITVTTSGKGTWDSTDKETKAASALASDGIMNISGGTLNLTSKGSGGKGIKCDSVLTISGGDITVKTSGGLYYNNGSTENTNYTGNTDRISNSYYSAPKGIKSAKKKTVNNKTVYYGGLNITGGNISVTTSGRNAEGIESKNTLNISGGYIVVNAYDDGINSAQDMTIDGGYIYSRATNNDGLDANGNLYINGGLVYAIGARSPELAIDANSEEQKKLTITGGTIIAIGGLESGSSLQQSCYSASWSASRWYSMTYGSETIAFKTPASGGNTMVLSASSQPTVKSGVTVSGGTSILGDNVVISPTITGGSSVTLSNYSSGGGNNPWNPWGW